VFKLKDMTWIAEHSGSVKFIFNRRSNELQLVVRRNRQEVEYGLRPMIQTKGTRTYVVNAVCGDTVRCF